MPLLLKTTLFFLLSINFAFAETDLQKFFDGRDGCVLVVELDSGNTVAEYNLKRCEERFSPLSTFKVAASLMAFDKEILKDKSQTISWDGVKHSRTEENRDQTPQSWMNDSVKWVTEWVTKNLGLKTVRHYLDEFDYGNKDFSGGLKNSWVNSTLKISAKEQIRFFTKLWKEELPVSKEAMKLTKEIIFVRRLGMETDLYGKIGSDCISTEKDCRFHSSKMFGWFVGVVKKDSKSYVIAANASDLKEFSSPAGPRMRDTAMLILKELNIVD